MYVSIYFIVQSVGIATFIFHLRAFLYRRYGSREESEVAGFFVFSLIRIMGYFRLD